MQLPKQDPVKHVTPKGDERTRIVRMRMALVMGSPFYGLLAMRMKLVEDSTQSTAWTDGKRMGYNPAYVAAMSDAELKGLIGHETMHCTNGHIWRRGTRHHKLWNLACDYAIDPVLERSGFEVPNKLVNPAWQGWSAEQIYSALMQEMEKQGKSLADLGDGPTKGEIVDAPEETSIQDQAEWKQAISSAAQIAKSQGKLPGDLEELIGELLAPRVDWKAVLRRFVQQCAALDYSWSAPSKRYMSMGAYLPRLRSEQMPPVVIVVDTSGSIGTEELKQFGGELSSIIEEAKPEIAHIVYADARVNGTAEFLPGDLIEYKPVGRGGTDFRPAFKWVEEQGIEPACLIYLTDMYGSFPDEVPEYPVIWASTTKLEGLPANYRAPFGEEVYLDFE